MQWKVDSEAEHFQIKIVIAYPYDTISGGRNQISLVKLTAIYSTPVWQ